MPCQSMQRRCVLTQGCEFISEDLQGNLCIPPFKQLKVSLLPNEKLDVLKSKQGKTGQIARTKTQPALSTRK